MRPSKILIAFACLLALGAGCSSNNPATDTTVMTGWSAFTSETGTFSAQFPTYPEYATENLPIDDSGATFLYESYSSETATGFFSVGVFTYPSDLDMTDVDGRLDGALQGMVSSTGGTVAASEYGYMGDHRTLSYTLTTPDGFRLKGFCVVVDHTVYQLIHVSAGTDSDEQEYQAFANSFKLN